MMPRLWNWCGLALLVAACGGTGDTRDTPSQLDAAGALLPDTQTVDGVLVMRHGADAFERAPQWWADSTPDLVIDGGSTFDLTYALRPVALPDGRSVVLTTIGGGQMMLFDTAGQPVRLLARTGQGPGELMSPGQPSVFGDTLVVVDGANRTINRYTADGGLLATAPVSGPVRPGIWSMFGSSGDGRRLSLYAGFGGSGADSSRRPPVPVAWIAPDFSRIDTVLLVPGLEVEMFESRYRGERRSDPHPVKYGLRSVVSTWGAGIAVGNASASWDLQRHDDSGHMTGRVVIGRPLRDLTPAMRDAEVAAELERIDGPRSEEYVDIEETRRQAREQPFADSLPPYQILLDRADGTLWAIDGQSRLDSTWSATILRDDGAILARVRGARFGLPVGVWGDRVVVRETDGDGVVRFAVYRVGAR